MTGKVRPGPKPQPHRKRTKAVNVRLTPAELKVIEGKAKPKPLAAYLRELGLTS